MDIACFTAPTQCFQVFYMCTFQRFCARFRDVVHVSEMLCTFPSSCARFTEVAHVSQKLCMVHKPPNNVRVQLHWGDQTRSPESNIHWIYIYIYIHTIWYYIILFHLQQFTLFLHHIINLLLHIAIWVICISFYFYCFISYRLLFYFFIYCTTSRIYKAKENELNKCIEDPQGCGRWWPSDARTGHGCDRFVHSQKSWERWWHGDEDEDEEDNGGDDDCYY